MKDKHTGYQPKSLPKVVPPPPPLTPPSGGSNVKTPVVEIKIRVTNK